MRRVTHLNASRHTYECVTPYECRARFVEKCMSHSWTRHVTSDSYRAKALCITNCEGVMSCIWLRHVAHVSWVMSHSCRAVAALSSMSWSAPSILLSLPLWVYWVFESILGALPLWVYSGCNPPSGSCKYHDLYERVTSHRCRAKAALLRKSWRTALGLSSAATVTTASFFTSAKWRLAISSWRQAMRSFYLCVYVHVRVCVCARARVCVSVCGAGVTTVSFSTPCQVTACIQHVTPGGEVFLCVRKCVCVCVSVWCDGGDGRCLDWVKARCANSTCCWATRSFYVYIYMCEYILHLYICFVCVCVREWGSGASVAKSRRAFSRWRGRFSGVGVCACVCVCVCVCVYIYSTCRSLTQNQKYIHRFANFAAGAVRGCHGQYTHV